MVEMSFKRVPAGYVFGAPNPWLIGPRQYYLLNEQQKSEVAVRLRRMWGYLFVAIVVAVSVIVPVSLSGIDQRPVTAFAIDVLVGLAIGLALNAYLYRSIRPVLAGLAPTAERITRGEAFQTQITVLSRGYIAFFGLLSLAMFALGGAATVLLRWLGFLVDRGRAPVRSNYDLLGSTLSRQAQAISGVLRIWGDVGPDRDAGQDTCKIKAP
jgi:hypothetical protein